MKIFGVLRMAGMISLMGIQASAGDLKVSPAVVSGGGGSSASSRFGLVGSIGQAVAGMESTSGGGIAARSGFWSQAVRWINAPPTTVEDTLTRRSGDGAQVLISRLLLNDSDADFDRVTFAGFTSATAAGGSVYRDGPWLIYQPPVGADPESDSITYQVADGFGGTASGVVQVVKFVPPYEGPPNSLGIATDPTVPGMVRVRFQGIAGLTYLVQTAPAITGPWVVAGPIVAGVNGRMEYVDAMSSEPRFYRLIEP